MRDDIGRHARHNVSHVGCLEGDATQQARPTTGRARSISSRRLRSGSLDLYNQPHAEEGRLVEEDDTAQGQRAECRLEGQILALLDIVRFLPSGIHRRVWL